MSAIKQDVNAPLILTIGVVSGLLLLVIVFGLEAWFVWEEQTETERKWLGHTEKRLIDLRESQRARITTPGTQPTTQPTISLQDAKQLIIQNGGRLPSTRPAGRSTTKPK